MKILRTASLGSSFTGSYKKECILFNNNLFLAVSVVTRFFHVKRKL